MTDFHPSKWTAIALAMVCVTGTFAFLIWHGVQGDNHQTFQDQQSALKDRIIAAQQQELRVALAELKTANDELRSQTEATAAGTRIFESNQQKMLAFVIALRNQQAALLKWVKTHPGQPIPASLLAPISVPTLQAVPSSARKATAHPKARSGTKRSAKHKPKH